MQPSPGGGPPPGDPGSLSHDLLQWSAAAFGAVAPAATVFGKAFLEALGQRAADGAAALPSKLRQRWFQRARRSHGDVEVVTVLDIENLNAAAILVTTGLPDEARLALLDLDPTEPALHGKVLEWNLSSQQWVPVEAPVTQVSPPPSERI
ncbi:hypothetical protein IU486_28765 [Streptomyces gardneri]|uniref:hypothetical protein n=1 Tax=Nocardia TaxID=1817 RepID=UPI00135A464F|nr:MULTISPECIES: hypothetical protein [Nocardia]MBF6168704.1 hypothetical protein [Streptomyces gardneri]MBF6208645.1 hypothetical protein [Streptomyces gardneri]